MSHQEGVVPPGDISHPHDGGILPLRRSMRSTSPLLSTRALEPALHALAGSNIRRGIEAAKVLGVMAGRRCPQRLLAVGRRPNKDSVNISCMEFGTDVLDILHEERQVESRSALKGLNGRLAVHHTDHFTT